MSPTVVFFVGLGLLGLFVAYFGTDSDKNKRLFGTILTIAAVIFCIISVQRLGLQQGIDLKGGSSFTLKVQPGPDGVITQSALEQARTVLRKRLDPEGKSDLLITEQGEDTLILQMPGVADDQRESVRKKIEEVALLELRMVHPQSASLAARVLSGEHLEPGYEVKQYRVTEDDDKEREEGGLLVTKFPDLTGDSISRAFPAYDAQGWTVNIVFNSEGKTTFGELTAANVGQRMAIVMDNEILSAPVIRTPIVGGQCEISGSFTEAQARALSSNLENPLKNPLVIQEERSVDASMGADTVKQGIYAGVAGLGITLLFMLIYYRIAGVIALIGLTVNIVLLFGAMALFGFTFTLPGIAGIVLTIGMAIDANVLIYERLREEMQAGKSLRAAVEASYEKAFSAIFDANATTFITATILFIVASGQVKGFAVTLTIGIIASMFAALIVTRVCFGWTVGGPIKKVGMGNLIGERHFDFLGKRKICGILSITAVVLCLGGVVYKGDSSLGIDFKGGALVSLKTEVGKEVDVEKIRQTLDGMKFTDAQRNEKAIQELTVQEQASATNEGENYIDIRADFGSGEAIENALTKEFGTDSFSISTDQVGPSIGKALLWRSVAALLLGLLGILIYVTIRFEFSFALGALVALFHDLIITMGIVVLSGYEFSLVLVGAFLTIAGYSINDTIVVFDRIRESLLTKRGNIRDVMNEAINATLGRTLLTSLTTLVMLITLYYFGGSALKSFSFTIIMGIVVGTYSSIFVASPIVYWWARVRNKSLRREVLDSDQQKVEAATGN